MVLGDADLNSRHVLRAILRAFDAFATPPPAVAGDIGAAIVAAAAAGAGRVSHHGEKLKRIKDFTG